MTRSLILTTLILIAIAAALIGPEPAAELLDTTLDVSSDNGPIVVELFTSQGCSSCPPADRLFGRLEGDVIPLSYHVDYWNHLGWQDPFSDSRWSERQRNYGRVLRPRGHIYTPQLVVNGNSHAVGSDLRKVSTMLREATEMAPAAQVALEVEHSTGTLRIAVEAQLDAAGSKASGTSRILVAITEDGLQTSIPSGENAHRTLKYHHVVRELRNVASLTPGSSTSQALEIKLKNGWKSDQLNVVAFVQSKKTLEIQGAARWRS